MLYYTSFSQRFSSIDGWIKFGSKFSKTDIKYSLSKRALLFVGKNSRSSLVATRANLVLSENILF